MGLFDNLIAGMEGFGQGFKSNVEANRATGEGFTDYRGTFDAQGARVPGTEKPNLLQLMQGSMTDNKGLFQGGEQGRMFGRYRDFADNVNAGNSGMTLPGGKIPDVPNQKGAVTTINTPDGESVTRYTDPTDEARAFAKTFNPSNPEDVFKMQNLFRTGGITDWQGNPISADSQWGYKSQSALDFLRSGQYQPESSYGVSGVSVDENLPTTTNNISSGQPAPVISSGPSNDFLPDPDPYGYNTTQPYVGGGGGIGVDALNLNQFR